MKFSIILLTILFLLTSNSFSSTIELKTDDVVEGTITELSNKKIKVNIGLPIDISLYIDEIKSIDSEPISDYIRRTLPSELLSSDGSVKPKDIYTRIKSNPKVPNQHFYPAGNLYIESNFDEDGFLNGNHKIFDPQGNIVERSSYVKGLKNGLTHSFYENGTVKSETNFKLGEQDGSTKFFYEDNYLFAILYDGNRSESSSDKLYKRDGTLITELFYNNEKLIDNTDKPYNGMLDVKYGNGNTFFRGVYKDGLTTDTFQSFYENGTIMTEEIYNNVDNCFTQKDFYRNGALRQEKIDCKKTNTLRIYDIDGNIAFELESEKN
ncbi:MAG: hypothetical protein KKF78_08570 [Candidatus Omnitrophica bacterium]|nr:hypothetical protein [Candidatus Omnitrophota bacterium]MBU1997193.1 hypothetical protein [Candidatus Omnitrophota bacterium]